MNKVIKPDAIFFDLDGTLWDGTDAYADGFNDYFLQNNIQRSITRDDLCKYLGFEEKHFLAAIFPELKPMERQKVYQEVIAFQYKRIRNEGGILFEGVRDGLAELAKVYKLFIVSNCSEFTIKYFMEWANISNLITDSMAHGENYKPKHENISLLMKSHDVKSPVYIGDTDSDRQQCELLNICFGYVSYGFGVAGNYSFKFDSFIELKNFFLDIKN